MSKRHSAKYQERVYKSLMPPLPVKEPVVTCALPPRLISRRDRLRAEKAAEIARLRAFVRETLGSDDEELR